MAKRANLHKYFRDYSKMHHGFEDHLEPLSPLDLSKVKNFSDLTERMSKTAFGGRSVGEAVDVLVDMTKDKNAFVVMTISGAMTVAKMGLMICDMIEKGLVNALVVTGALMAHGLAEAAGMKHFKVPQNYKDDDLYLKGYDRVYDTLELEENLDDIEGIISKVLKNIDPNKVLSSRLLCEKMGEFMAKNSQAKGVLKSAYLQGVPVYIPAFTDSELGLDFGIYNRERQKEGLARIRYDPFLDLDHYTELIWKQKRLGIFTIGGGVPRNWAQQVGPYIDIINYVNHIKNNKPSTPPVMFQYGVRICPEPVHWGGLSGCTYSEGVSWGKFVPQDRGGKFAEVPSDATIVWPLILKATFERLGPKKIRKNIFAGRRAVREIEKLVEGKYGN